MPSGTCDPASRGQSTNAGTITGGDTQEVVVDYQYGWDGTSVRPDCVGPLNQVTVRNTSATVTYYAHFKGRRGTPLRLDMPPGFNQTYNKGQLGSRGFSTNTDLENAYITKDPNPPTTW